MIYIIDGEEEVFIRRKINEFKKNENIDVIFFDGNDRNFNIDELVDSCNSNTLFSQKSIVLVKDPNFLIKKVEEKVLNTLFEYVTNPIYETELIFYTFENKFNQRLKAYKEISKNAQIIHYDCYDYKNFNTYANSLVNKLKLNINKEATELLISICKMSATLLHKNLEILINYPEKIDSNVISNLCTASDDNNAFELINALTNKNISKSISIERRLFKDSDSIISVIGLLANQLRFLYQISYLQSLGKRKSEIIEITKCNEFRYNKSLETLRNLNTVQIISLLNELSKIDIECKSDNSISDISRFELFILNLLAKGRNYASN